MVTCVDRKSDTQGMSTPPLTIISEFDWLNQMKPIKNLSKRCRKFIQNVVSGTDNHTAWITVIHNIYNIKQLNYLNLNPIYTVRESIAINYRF